MKRIVIDGNNFSDLEGFYNEVERVFTHNLTWKVGRNLNAFNDILRGGFGLHDYGEPVTLIWKNIEKSKEDLGYSETVKSLRHVLKLCHPTNREYIKSEIIQAENHQGKTIFDDIIAIIKDHEHIDIEYK